MTGVILRLALALAGLSAALAGLICAQPYDGATLAMFLGPPEGCPIPCWQGIRPGATTGAQALDILSHNPWVGQIKGGEFDISWTWSGRQPSFVDATHEGLLGLTSGIVRQVRIQTLIPFGDVWALLRPPERARLVRPLSRASAYQIAWFSQYQIYTVTTLSCPMGPGVFWTATATLGLGDIWTTEAINGADFSIFGAQGWWQRARVCRR